MIFKVDTLTDNTVKLKVVSIILGIVDVILGAIGSCGYANDLFFLDFVYHALAACIILLASIILLSSTSPTTCGVMEKTSSATLAIINSCLYLYISWVVLQHLRDKGDKESFLPLHLLCIFSRNPVVVPSKERSTSPGGNFPPEMPRSPTPLPTYQMQQQQQYQQRPTSQTQIVQVKSAKTPSPIPPQTPVET